MLRVVFAHRKHLISWLWFWLPWSLHKSTHLIPSTFKSHWCFRLVQWQCQCMVPPHPPALFLHVDNSQLCQVLSKRTYLPCICAPVGLQPFMRWYRPLQHHWEWRLLQEAFPFHPSWHTNSWHHCHLHQAFARWHGSLSFFFPYLVLFIRFLDSWEQGACFIYL